MRRLALLVAASLVGLSGVGLPRGAAAQLPPQGPPGAAPPVPTWTKDELKGLFSRAEMAGNQETTEGKDAEMARTMGSAYRILPNAGETADAYARRVLKKIEPVHPEVKQGQWILALARRFYLDTGKRADTLARIEPIRTDRQLLEVRAQQGKATADAISGMLVTKLDTSGLMSPMPSAAGDVPNSFGCEAYVRGEKIEVNKLDRMVFANHQVPPEATRSGRGAIRELVATMKDYNMRAQTMGMIDPAMKQGNKKLRMFIPSNHPALYLNELAAAAEEGGMVLLFVMVVDPADGKMREIPLVFSASKAPRPKGKKAKPVAPVKIHCADDDTMQACATKLAAARAEGAVLVYEPPQH